MRVKDNRDIGLKAFQEERASDGAARQWAAEQAVLLTYADGSVRERHAIVRGAELQGLHARAHDGWPVGADA